MLDYTHDEEIGAWYFSSDGGKGDVCRTQAVPLAFVNIDWDHYGNVLGVEVLYRPLHDSITIDTDDLPATDES